MRCCRCCVTAVRVTVAHFVGSVGVARRRELKDMLRLGKDNNVEVCLFVGPRSSWDTSATARTEGGKNVIGHKGSDQLAAALEDVRWAVDRGLRSILVADLGLMYVIGKLVKAGKLPSNLVTKVSVLMGPMNAVRAAWDAPCVCGCERRAAVRAGVRPCA